ncbi:MAG TPA: signal recognition particle-docking protein FtsY [Clostridiaceae bacterium]
MLNFFEKLKSGLSKTKGSFTDKIMELLRISKEIDENFFDELEEILITSDIGYDTTELILVKLKERIKKEKIKEVSEVYTCLKLILKDMLHVEPNNATNTPKIILVIGVNGVGKTTSIGKLAWNYKNLNKKVMVAAADTFRAAAIDQLEVWCRRANVDIIKQQEGSDPAAVVFDAVATAKVRKADYLICDTAGRLHNKKNLMNELGKINRIIEREGVGFSKETYLVLDATTGQNGLAQAKQFMEVCTIDGLILTKLDGTAKGGVVLSIKNTLNLPVRYIGIGEGIEDLQEFNSENFIEALFGC